VVYVFQNPTTDFLRHDPRRVMFARAPGLAAPESPPAAEESLRLFGLGDYADLPPAVLGYGLRRMVSIAAVWTMQPRVWILDEPTAGLDARSADQLLALAERLHAEGRTIILVSHDMRLVAQYARDVLVMHEGRVLARGAAARWSPSRAMARANSRRPR
jgi:energy-coupling factor transport system ATP-binding protein